MSGAPAMRRWLRACPLHRRIVDLQLMLDAAIVADAPSRMARTLSRPLLHACASWASSTTFWTAKASQSLSRDREHFPVQNRSACGAVSMRRENHLVRPEATTGSTRSDAFNRSSKRCVRRSRPTTTQGPAERRQRQRRTARVREQDPHAGHAPEAPAPLADCQQAHRNMSSA